MVITLNQVNLANQIEEMESGQGLSRDPSQLTRHTKVRGGVKESRKVVLI